MRRAPPIRLAMLVVAMLVLSTGARPARAEAGTAQAQFDYGLAEMEGGRYATACPALAESYRLDPHPGVLFTLAECENKAGRLASALTHYDAYLDLFVHMSDAEKARQRGRDRISLAQRDRLRLEVPELAIALPATAPSGTSVTRDGTPLAAPSLGVPAPVDPGEHVVAARTPDGVVHEERVTLSRGEHRSVSIDLWRRPPAPPPPPSFGEASAPNGALAPALKSALAPDPSPSPLRTWAWIAAAVGATGLAVGAGAGAAVMADKSTIDANCHPDKTCNAQGLSAARSASTLGVVSDVGFALGAAGVVGAVVLFTRSPSGAANVTAAVQPSGGLVGGGGFVGLRGTW
jgi:hypothetical protein